MSITVERLIAKAYTPMLTQTDITYLQYRALMVLWENSDEPLNDIAHRLYKKKCNFTKK